MFHRTNFDLSLLAGWCCNKSQVVKSLDTSWHPLQKNSKVLPVSFRFGMKDGQVPVAALCLHIWLAATWAELRFCVSWSFLVTSSWAFAVTHHSTQQCSGHTSHSKPHNSRLWPSSSRTGFPPPELQQWWNLMWNICSSSPVPIPGLCKKRCYVKPCKLARYSTWETFEQQRNEPAHLVYITTIEAFYVALQSMNLSWLLWFTGWPGSGLQNPQPLKVLCFCTSPKANKKSDCFFKAPTCTPTSTVTISLKWPWHRNSTYCKLWTGAE